MSALTIRAWLAGRALAMLANDPAIVQGAEDWGNTLSELSNDAVQVADNIIDILNFED